MYQENNWLLSKLLANRNPLPFWRLRFFFRFRNITPTVIVATAANIPTKISPTISETGRGLAGGFPDTAADGAANAGVIVVAGLVIEQ